MKKTERPPQFVDGTCNAWKFLTCKTGRWGAPGAKGRTEKIQVVCLLPNFFDIMRI